MSPAAPLRRRTFRALASLALLLVAPLTWLWFIDQPFLRATALTSWVALGAALVLALSAARADARPWVRGIALLQLAALALFVWFFFAFARLPSASAATLARAPDFTLPDQGGRPVHLADELARGPVLLVFYRGHW